MIKTLIALSLVAVTSAVGGQMVVTKAGTATGAAAGERTERSFMSPRIDGRRLDVRYSATEPLRPQDAATVFCQENGFSEAIGYSVQNATSTRTIGDNAAQRAEQSALTAFYAIRCAGHIDGTTVAARS